MSGDELPYPVVSRHQIEALIGEKLDEDIPIEEVIAAASETYHLFFLIPDLARRKQCESRWRELLGDRVICMESHEDTCAVAAAIVGLTEGTLPNIDAVVDVLRNNGTTQGRAAATVRALQPYADLLDPNAPQGVFSALSSMVPVRPTWWKKLFD